MTLLRAIIVVILLYYLLRFIFKAVVPYWLRQMFRDIAANPANYSKTTNQTNNTQFNHSSRRSKIDNNIGEYVDYEEVKD